MPRATYRVQLHAGFTLDDAAAIVPYLAALGISHLYTSPVLQAAPGSTHGYDVVDHSRVNDELGAGEAFERLTDALRAHDMGLVLDIVPNHMAITGEENRWWWDVLQHGRSSRYATFFDVDWSAGALLLPVLEDDYRRVLEAGGIRLVRDEERLLIQHADRRFPLAPATAAPILAAADQDAEVAAINADPDRLDALLERQHYRLASWRAALSDLRYRRFFDVNDLIGLRVEEEEVFGEVHRLPLQWVAAGLVDGLRIDHPDGLRDPAGYLARLRAAAPDAWIVVEKILGADEALPAGWPVDGTTGYRFANLATGLFVDPAGETAMTEQWAALADGGPGWAEIAGGARAGVLDSLLGSDLNWLTDLFASIGKANGHDRGALRQAVREVAVRLPVYRTYATSSPRCLSEGDGAIIRQAVGSATAARADLDPALFALLGRVLRIEHEEPPAAELAMRFQQLTPAAMAKGVEDTAFYRHHRLVALNEVGGDPGRFGTSVADFHRHMRRAADDWPDAMLSLSTHDTKRSADVRARLAPAVRGPGGLVGSRRAPWPCVGAAPNGARAADELGCPPLLPDPRRRMADRCAPSGGLPAEGKPRGEAANLVDRAELGVRGGHRAVRPRLDGRSRLRRGRGAGGGAAARRGPPSGARPARPAADGSRRPGHLPGRRAVAAGAGRSRQPPAGRLRRTPAAPRRIGGGRRGGRVGTARRWASKAVAPSPWPRPAAPP